MRACCRNCTGFLHLWNLFNALSMEEKYAIFIFFLLLVLIAESYRKRYRKNGRRKYYKKKRDQYYHHLQKPSFSASQSPNPFKQKGDEFERYVVHLFPKNRNFVLHHWRSDKISNGVYAASNQHPDLEIIYNDGSTESRKIFAVECKWRARFIDDKIEWASEQQINNYLNYQRETKIPVYVAIGVGGTPSSPSFLFFVPLQEIERYPVVYKSHLNKFARNSRQLFSFDTKRGIAY